MVTYTSGLYRVTQTATGVAGSPYYFTAYFAQSGGTAQQAADAWRAFLSAGVSTYIAGMVFANVSDVTLVDPVTGNVTGTTPVVLASVTFTGAGDPLPPATSLLCRYRTGEYINGHEIRGRTNISGLTETDNTLGSVSTSTQTTWNARLATLITGGTKVHAVYSPTNHCWAATTAATVSSQWAVLRTRRD
jgi:hypothetical protein